MLESWGKVVELSNNIDKFFSYYNESHGLFGNELVQIFSSEIFESIIFTNVVENWNLDEKWILKKSAKELKTRN